MNMYQDLDSRDRLAKRFTRQGVWFQPPTPPTLSPKGDSSNSKAKLPPIMSIPLVWDMEDMYGASKGPVDFGGKWHH